VEQTTTDNYDLLDIASSTTPDDEFTTTSVMEVTDSVDDYISSSFITTSTQVEQLEISTSGLYSEYDTGMFFVCHYYDNTFRTTDNRVNNAASR
jgi:hypothetical protein